MPIMYNKCDIPCIRAGRTCGVRLSRHDQVVAEEADRSGTAAAGDSLCQNNSMQHRMCAYARIDMPAACVTNCLLATALSTYLLSAEPTVRGSAIRVPIAGTIEAGPERTRPTGVLQHGTMASGAERARRQRQVPRASVTPRLSGRGRV